MKIEKISDNQIRCTLTQQDLAERKLQLSELAYGTEKAKSLFHDMMQQAAFEFGFEADNMPLMIEAIPTSADSCLCCWRWSALYAMGFFAGSCSFAFRCGRISTWPTGSPLPLCLAYFVPKSIVLQNCRKGSGTMSWPMNAATSAGATR